MQCWCLEPCSRTELSVSKQCLQVANSIYRHLSLLTSISAAFLTLSKSGMITRRWNFSGKKVLAPHIAFLPTLALRLVYKHVKVKTRRLPPPWICNCRSSLLPENTVQRQLDCRIKSSTSSPIWFWKSAVAAARLMKLGMLRVWLRKPQTSFQLALMQFKNAFIRVLLGKKVNPFSFFQNVLSKAHSSDNAIFIQPLPAVINFLYKRIHDNTCSCAPSRGWYAASIPVHIQVGIQRFSHTAFAAALSVLALLFDE